MRDRKGWSQVRLAGLASVTVGAVRKLEGGQVATLSAGTLYRVADALGCAVVDLVPGFAVRREGLRAAVAVDAPRRRVVRERAEARRLQVCAWLVELLRGQGGRMAAVAVCREFAKYGLSRDYLQLRRRECGIESVRRAGFGNRADCWDWVLPGALSGEAQPPPQHTPLQ